MLGQMFFFNIESSFDFTKYFITAISENCPEVRLVNAFGRMLVLL
jgi:hypothetical protein